MTMKRSIFFAVALAMTFLACDPEEVTPVAPQSHSNEVISQPTVWKVENNPHTITGTVTVNGGVLTIEPGAIIKFAENASLIIDGQNSSLVAVGTPEKPITFTSASANPVPGNWESIVFKTGVVNCQMAFCNVEYGGGNSSYGMIEVRGSAQVSVNNCNLKKSHGPAARALDENGFVSFANNTLESTANHALSLSGKNVKTLGPGNTFIAGPGFGILVSASSSGTIIINDENTWAKQNVPYFLKDEMSIRGGGKLILQPGVILKMMAGNYINVGYNGENGQFLAKGTVNDSVYITSASSAPQAGDWKFIRFQSGAINCELEYCNVSYGGGDSYVDMIYVKDNGQLSIKNSTFSNAKQITAISAIDDTNGFTAFENNVIYAPTGRHAMRLRGCYVDEIGEGNVFHTSAGYGVQITGGVSYTSYISADAIWKKLNVPYIASDNIVVYENATLTIAPGTIIMFDAGKTIEIGYSSSYGPGRIMAVGTLELPIVFTSSSAAPQNGDWSGIIFNSYTLADSELDYCVVEYAGKSYGNIEVYPCGAGNPKIQNCVIKNSKKYGVYKRKVSGVHGDPLLVNNTFIDNISGDIGQQ